MLQAHEAAIDLFGLLAGLVCLTAASLATGSTGRSSSSRQNPDRIDHQEYFRSILVGAALRKEASQHLWQSKTQVRACTQK
jgi:hypothetical protein